MMNIDLRNANIGVAVAGVIFFVGGYLFRDSEGILTIVVLAGFFLAIGVTVLLDEREERRQNRPR